GGFLADRGGFARAPDRRRGHAEPRAFLLFLRRPRSQGFGYRAELGEREEARPAAGGSHVQTVFEDGENWPRRTRQIGRRGTDLQRPRRERTEEVAKSELNVVPQNPKGLERAFESRRAVRFGAGEAETFPGYGRSGVEKPRQSRLRLESFELGSL